MDDSLQQGIIAYKAGKQDVARKIFITVIKQSPDSEAAWGWMYQASSNDQERINCLKQILRINPKSEKAKQLLNNLEEVENNILNKKDTPMPDLTQKDKPKLTPDQHKYSEMDYVTANNSLLAKIEGHLQSIRSMLTFFVLITVLSIILGGCNLLLSIR